MMMPMELLAIATGMIVCWIVLADRRIDFVLILFYFVHVRSRGAFEALYENADDEATFSLNNHSELDIKTYADYLRLHQAVSQTAYSRFLGFYDKLVRLLLIRMLPVLLLPAILFWSRWYFYLLGTLVAGGIIVIYKTFIVRRKVGFYQRMLIGAILANYQKEQKKKTK
jgi:hypothetical protein